MSVIANNAVIWRDRVLWRTGRRRTYFPGAAPAPDLTVAGTPEQVARGEYLVNLSCVGCHSAPGPEGNPTGERTLSQEQFVAVMRGGVKPDGVAFPETMPWENAAKMTDADLAALYAYLTAPLQ